MKKFSLSFFLLITFCAYAQKSPRTVKNFDRDWTFNLGEVTDGQNTSTNDSKWRKLNLPHDWSVEGEFSKDNPATPEGGALPGGIGWYRKTFSMSKDDIGKQVYIAFDGVYQKSDVWINGHHLGFRPNGYISFRYDMTPYLKFGKREKNVIAVKVDNSVQPNSRWYSGSGIYRNVWLITTGKIAVDHWGTFVTTSKVGRLSALVNINVTIRQYTGKTQKVDVVNAVYTPDGVLVATQTITGAQVGKDAAILSQDINVVKPILWSVDHPYLYKVTTKIMSKGQLLDEYSTPLGIRYFNFDADKGFSLNGKPMKILGVCDHHDLGSLGAALNTHALERQLTILKDMGCNAIRTSHNPPAPELLDMADKMGFIIMDEAFDCWEKGKVKFDYHLYFKEWHKRDLEDQILRDRNHPSVVIWSIGNEIPQQTDTSGFRVARDLAAIVHSLDTTRPITTANDHPDTSNQIIKSGAIDLIGYNYHQFDYATFHTRYPGKKFIGTETTSALETRGVYDMPSDSIRRWPTRDGKHMNADYTVSAYDNVAAPWGATHEENWKIIKKYGFLSGMFLWTGFDYLGEPTPYSWPARSSYFGVIDLAGFPKDIYYMYQAEWSDKRVLHIFPDWNHKPGEMVDVWAYYSGDEDVELFLNGKSLGKKKKTGDDLHVMWRVKYEPGTLKAVVHRLGLPVTAEIKTAGAPAKIELEVDKRFLKGDGTDLAFITAKVVDKNGVVVPYADNEITFNIKGKKPRAFINATDNGDPVNHEPFKSHSRKAFHGLALAIIQSNLKTGLATVTAQAPGLPVQKIKLWVK